MNTTYPLPFPVRQLAGPAFAAMLGNLGFPKNLSLDLFHDASKLVSKALDERPVGQKGQAITHAFLSSLGLTGNWGLDQRRPRVIAVVCLGHLCSHAISTGGPWYLC